MSRSVRRHAARALSAAFLLLPLALEAQRGAPPALRLEPFTLETRSHGRFDGELGTLQVPVRHHRPAGPQRAIRFVRLRALSGSPGAPPVVYLAGGPGGSGIEAARGARWPLFRAVQEHADVILLDQRGTGRSDPPPPCPAAAATAPRPEVVATHQTMLASLRAEAARCVSAWRAQGVDLDAYSTAESARDIDLVRRAIGAERVSLWGMSYGTHLALAALRLHPTRVARVVLMGTEGPDHTLKRPLDADRLLEEVHAWAAADSVARSLTPDLLGTLRRQLARLDAAPVVAELPGAGGQAHRVTLGRFDLELVVATMLARTQTAALLPVMLGSLERGDPTWLARFAMQVRQEHFRLAAMPLAMDVASGATAARRALVGRQARESLLGDALNFPWPSIGDGLGILDLGDRFRGPIRSRVPALFVSGTLDGRTPPANAEEVRSGFSDASHIVLAGAGHDDDLWTSSPVVAERIARFLSGHPVSGGTISTPLLKMPRAAP